MLKQRSVQFVLFLFLIILSACAPQAASPSPAPQQPSGGLVTKDKAPFALAAKAALSQKLAIPVDQVGFVSAEAVQWTDSCLGLGGPAESCLQAITPGYKVILSAAGKQYEVRTDETGSVVRIPE